MQIVKNTSLPCKSEVVLVTVATRSLLAYEMRKIWSGNNFETTDGVPWSYLQALDSSVAGLSAGQQQSSSYHGDKRACRRRLVSLWHHTTPQARPGVPGALCGWEEINLLMPPCRPRYPLLLPCSDSHPVLLWLLATCFGDIHSELLALTWTEFQKIYSEICR